MDCAGKGQVHMEWSREGKAGHWVSRYRPRQASGGLVTLRPSEESAVGPSFTSKP